MWQHDSRKTGVAGHTCVRGGRSHYMRTPPPPFMAGAARRQRITGPPQGTGIPKPPNAGALACWGAHSDLPCGTCTIVQNWGHVHTRPCIYLRTI